MARRLLHLGYLDWIGPRDGKARNAAIQRAERAHGLTQTGRPSPALLAKLLAASGRAQVVDANGLANLPRLEISEPWLTNP